MYDSFELGAHVRVAARAQLRHVGPVDVELAASGRGARGGQREAQVNPAAELRELRGGATHYTSRKTLMPETTRPKVTRPFASFFGLSS